jgi:hypothetical protein
VKLAKHALIALVLPLALLAQGGAFAADIPGEQFVITNPPTSDRYTGLNLAGDNAVRNTFSSLEAFTADGTSKQSKVLTHTNCLKIGTAGCEANKYFQYNAQLGMCNSKLITDCVTSVFARNSEGKTSIGTLVEEYPGPTEYTYEGDPTIGLPTGGSTFIVDFPEFPHEDGTKYLVVVWMQGSRGFNEKQFSLDYFSSGIFAVKKVAGKYTRSGPGLDDRSNQRLEQRWSYAGGLSLAPGAPRSRSACVQTSLDDCLLPYRLPLDATFGLTIKLHEKVSGWVHGRFTDADANITSTGDGDQLLTIQGKPIVVPAVYGWFKKDSYPAPLQKLYAGVPAQNIDGGGLGWPSTDPALGNWVNGVPYSIMKENFGYDEGGIAESLAWISALGDKAAYSQSMWSFKSMTGQIAGCLSDTSSLSGIVSTNSTMYIAGPPTFNKEDQSLDYKVAAPHSLEDGNLFKGTYDLVIKSSVARCIYGFSNAPISAKISILSADGSTQVATTTFTEKDGWMHLIARGFTFSSPTVKVKFSQEGSNQQARPVVTEKKISITCVKGKSSKKVTAVKPVCPSGWKKK